MFPWILLLLLCSRCRQSSGSLCDVREYEKDGRCCALCRPGQFLVRDCTEHNKTVCSPCSDGEYQDQYHRETRCLLHRECNENLGFEKISEGTPTSNLQCRCETGRHCSSDACETCVSNKICGPGEGVTQNATSFSDTKCSPCNEGTYSDTPSQTEPCKNWRTCGDAEMIMEPGTPTSDVVCGPSPTNAWVYVVLTVLCIVGLTIPAFIIYKKLYRNGQKEIKQDPNKEEELLKIDIHKENLPEEDQDDQDITIQGLPVEDQVKDQDITIQGLPVEGQVKDQDITMQGLPVAQEQGKDYHMSQEEV